ncbi:hypothetical protein [Nonomuraea jiangxiensis]|uniref:DUF5666 domain-containing protein n=1 Tax=Nonomuraea jiangxiensis TaxID=633440 RepID=A0A1G8WQ35_9ACTN|nr:hypothetical protein [Nonomuraea jiangxiensis]SDJ80223.1 hypothetical protein SAMN05421869_112231 [Nonomuraea jiangxiensis]
MAQLDSSPYPDDLREELAVRPRAGMSKLTLTLAAGVVLVAGILIGIQAGKAAGGRDVPAAAQQRGGGPMGGFGGREGGVGQGGQPDGAQGGQPGFGAQRGGGQRMGAAGGGTLGTVEKVEGGKVYVKTADGTTVMVLTDAQTAVTVSQAGKVADLKTGATVVVRGRQGEDGSVTAVSINQGGQGGRR